MSKNVLIGIGGTGSRVIESVVHLCAAGFGPDKLHVFLIDPDAGNGNLTRTQTLIKQYSEIRKRYQRIKGNPSFHTEIIIPPDNKPYVWNIFEERESTLEKFINFENLKQNDPSLASLASILFTEQELKTELDEGFRGHPSIGSVVMADPPMNEYPFKLLWDNIESLGANELKVFLVGSIFGGTGAAGFPTLGSKNLIKYNQEKEVALADGKSKVLLGGALVLPYFTFSSDANTTEKMFVTPSDFPIATKAALQYYDTKDLGFDQYYFIGDSLAQKVGEFNTGTAKQLNRPHYVEIASALASFDFFGQPHITGLPDKKYFIAQRKDQKIDWYQIPLTRDGEKIQDQTTLFKKRIADFAVFAYSYLTYGKECLDLSHRDLRLEPWYGDNFKDFKEENPLLNPRHDENKAIYKDMDDYLSDFLYWIAAMDDGENGYVSLINKENLFEGNINPEGPVKLKDPRQYKANIGQVLKNTTTNNLNFDAFKVRGLQEAFTDAGAEGQNQTINAGSKYLNLFYYAASRFNDSNLVVN